MGEQQNSPKQDRKISERHGKQMSCPKCKNLLIVAEERDVEVDFCEECKGVWVGYIDEKKILEIKPEAFSIDELRRLRRLFQPEGNKEETGYFSCPVCQKLMWRKIWASHSGVLVDKCRDHGTWYDEGELDKIRAYIKLGGIEYEKLRLTEVGLSELDQKLMRTAERLDKRIDSAYRRARLYSLIGF